MISNVLAFGIFCNFVMNLAKNSAFLKIWNLLDMMVELARDWILMFVGPLWYISLWKLTIGHGFDHLGRPVLAVMLPVYFLKFVPFL